MLEGSAGSAKRVETRPGVVIRFAGDSGDGMQVTGLQFTTESALAGNDLATLPDFPAEIRAPAGTLAGVSAFQLNFACRARLHARRRPRRAGRHESCRAAHEPGRPAPRRHPHRRPRSLQRRQPAQGRLRPQPARRRLARALAALSGRHHEAHHERSQGTRPLGARGVPLPQLLLSRRHVVAVPPPDRADGCSGSRPSSARTPRWSRPTAARCAPGWRSPRMRSSSRSRTRWRRPPIPAGTYRNVTGNTATALGLVAAANRAGLPIFLGSYPITPASDVLHELAGLKQFDVVTFQAEDEIAGIGAALGAAFGGAIGVTTTSGPGMDLKAETLGLALAVELPLIVCDIQRAGPSTGMPTKTEQADLLMAMYGRHGEAPAADPGSLHAVGLLRRRVRGGALAIKYMTPVIILSDGYLANGAEPWLIPVRRAAGHPGRVPHRSAGLLPLRARRGDAVATVGSPGNPRPRAPHRRPGEGGRHRERELRAANHEQMVRLRARKMAGIARDPVPARSSAQHPRPPGGRLGQHVRIHPPGGDRPASRRTPGCARAPAPHESAAVRSGRDSAPCPARAGARDQPGTARARAARRVPGAGDRLPEDPGPAVQGLRAGRPLHAPARGRRGPRGREKVQP